MDPAALAAALARTLAPDGLDLLQPFRTGTYDDAVPPEYRLPDLGRGPDALGILVASTRAVWPALLAALRAEPARIDRGHPLDRWLEERVRAALAALPVRSEARFAPELPPRRVAMQRLAHLSGLAPLGPAHLNVHPTFGPWIGLRAAIVFDAPAPPEPSVPLPLPDPCTRCECAVRLEELTRSLDRSWTDWLALRDACPVGREHRYAEEQIRYHYLKDPAILRAAISARRA